jgi:hypothetical protein
MLSIQLVIGARRTDAAGYVFGGADSELPADLGLREAGTRGRAPKTMQRRELEACFCRQEHSFWQLNRLSYKRIYISVTYQRCRENTRHVHRTVSDIRLHSPKIRPEQLTCWR